MQTFTKVGLEALLTPENCVLLLIDHQPSQLANVNSHEPTMVINNVTALAKTAKAYGVPTILTTINTKRGGEIFSQIQAVFPDGGTVAISRFGEYEEQSYFVWARAETGGMYRLGTRPLDQGGSLSTKALSLQAFKKTLRALQIPDPQISAIKKSLDTASLTEIGGRFARRVFSAADLIAAGFEATSTE